MAQKAAKTLAASNARRLNTTLYLTLGFHLFYWLFRALLFRSSFTRRSLLLYILFSSPQLLINYYFEKLSRPTYSADGTVLRSGEDLEAKGMTEYMWDVTYWTYGNLVLAALLGDGAWWLYAVIPGFAAYLAYTTFVGARQGLGGMGQDAAGVPQQQASKRQAKMEKRGGQKVQYR